MHGKAVMRDAHAVEFRHKRTAGRNDDRFVPFFFQRAGEVHHPAFDASDFKTRQQLEDLHLFRDTSAHLSSFLNGRYFQAT